MNCIDDEQAVRVSLVSVNPSERSDAPFATLRRKLVLDTLRYIPGVIVPAAASVAGVAVFTRLFDADEYGRYALVIATTTTVTHLLAGWIQPSTLRFLPRYRSQGRLDEFMGEARALLTVVSMLILAVMLPLYPLVADRLGVFRPFFVPAVMVAASELLVLNVTSIYQGSLRSGLYAAGRGTSAALRFLFGLTLVLSVSRDVVSLVYAIAAANFFVAIPMLVGLRSRTRLLLPSKAFVRSFAAYGVPLIGWMVCNQVLQVSDRYIIGAFRGASEVGIYAANYNLVLMGFGLISTPILLAAHPIIMDAWEHKRHSNIPDVISRFSRYYLVAITPLLAFVWIFSLEIVSILLGPDFREGHRVIPLLLGSVLVWGFSMYGHKGLELKEKTRTLLVLIAVATSANVLLNFIFVPKYGYVGAAATTLASFLLYPLMLHPTTRRHIPWRIPWLSALRIAVCAAAAAGIFWLTRAGLDSALPRIVYMLIAGVAGTVVYIVLLFALRVLRRDELRSLAS